MLSAVGVYGMIAGEAGSEVYAVANDRQQARIIFNEAIYIPDQSEISNTKSFYIPL